METLMFKKNVVISKIYACCVWVATAGMGCLARSLGGG